MRRWKHVIAGFTLLEVLVAIAILGLGLTAVLSAQTGLFQSSTRTERISIATGLLRCRMNELELELLKDGYPLIDESGEGFCCEDEPFEGYRCSWKVDRIELPDPPTFSDEDGESTGDPEGESGASGLDSLGPMAGLAAIQQDSNVLGQGAGLGDLSELLGGAAVGGAQSMAPMVMSLVYPQLKPMLEASIRKVSVTVTWKEGARDRELLATQFLSDPQQGGFEAENRGLEDAVDNMLQSMPGATPASGTGGGN